MAAEEDKIARIRGQLKAMIDNLPKWSSFPARYVKDYEALLASLQNAGLNVLDFGIGEDHLRAKVSSFNYLTKETNYADELHIDRAPFLARMGGLLTYLDKRAAPDAATGASKADSRAFGSVSISGGNVTFGDGSHVNITNVTVAQLLAALERHVESTVADPAQKKSLLAKVSEVLRHPAATTALQVGLPQLLKLLGGGAGGAV
jgi:hypothetical protein